MARRLRQEAGAQLSPSQTAALATIERHGPLTPSELAERERVQRPTVTRVLARLEEAGLVERAADPGDRRCSLVSISAEETVFEDVSLGFKHKIPLYRPAPGAATTSPNRPPIQGAENYVPYNPNPNPNFQVQPGQSIPGIPDNIPRYVPPNANRVPDKKDQDDDDDGDGKP